MPQKEPNVEFFSKEELNIVDDVIHEFVGYNATSISEFSHREWAWRSTKDYEEIPYNLAWVSADPLTLEQIEVGTEIAERIGPST